MKLLDNMKKQKVLLIGSGPLPSEAEGIRNAAGLRTEQFLSPLQKESVEICTVLIQEREKSSTKNIHRFLRSSPNLLRNIRHIITDFSPDVCIAVNTFPSFIASKVLPKEIPFWADLNGWIMAEAQVRSYEMKSNGLIPHCWNQEKTILKRADKVSTVSTPQKFATLGEMATLGRLRAENNNQEMVTSIPNATKIFSIDTPQKEHLFRGKKVPKDAIVIAWVGGYNNWSDEKVLFEALEKSMETEEKLYFVSTGGNIDNIATGIFGRFQKYIQQSAYKKRFVFLGWIDTKDMANIYYESDIGICTDILCTETETGARNRINEMMKFAIPVVTTSGSEIAEVVKNYKCGVVSQSGDSDELKNNIIQLCQNNELRTEMGKNGKIVATEIYNENILFKPIKHFIAAPYIAPDRKNTALDMSGSIWSKLSGAFFYARQNGIKSLFRKVIQYIS